MKTVLTIVTCILLLVSIIYMMFDFENFYDTNMFRIKESSHLIERKYPASEIITYSQKIPFVIHQTYYKNRLNTDLYQTCMTIRNMNPEYEYRFYDDNDSRDYIETYYPKHYLKAYDSIIPGAYKADIFRYLVLLREGGVYMDCKSSTIVPLRDFIPNDCTFAVFRDRPAGALLNSFMACTPEHPILKKVIDMTIDNVLHQRYNANSLDITGPQTLGRAFNSICGRNELDDIEPGVYGKNRNFVVVGSFYVIGEGENEFDALVDTRYKPLVSKTMRNYYNNPRRIDYQTLWNNRQVYKLNYF